MGCSHVVLTAVLRKWACLGSKPVPRQSRSSSRCNLAYVGLCSGICSTVTQMCGHRSVPTLPYASHLVQHFFLWNSSPACCLISLSSIFA